MRSTSQKAAQAASALEFSINGFAAVRLLSIYVYAKDLRETGVLDRAPKLQALKELTDATASWADGIDLPSHLARLASLKVTDVLPAATAADLRLLRSHLGAEEVLSVLIETVTSLEWPDRVDWVVDRFDVLAEAAQLLDPSADSMMIEFLKFRHKAAAKRLRKDSLAPAAQVGMGAFMLAGALLSGGAANAIGTAVGTHVLGLSGAAATSAGLALLGGGSLASGGFGMAGGALLINTATFATRSAGKSLMGSVIARESSSTFIHQLAKLDVRCQFEPHLQTIVVRSLVELATSLRLELSRLRQLSGGHPSEQRNLAASVRAIEAEIGYLTAPGWKRLASRVPRMMGMPGLSKVFDLFD